MSVRTPARPIFFLHIEKTGGTSLIRALCDLFPPERRFMNETGVSSAYVEQVTARLAPGSFVAGHTHRSCGARLALATDVITILRRPRDQAVSHYFHARFDRAHPHHADAYGLSFTGFALRHPHYLAFQTRALAEATAECDAEASQPLIVQASRVRGFLRTIRFVGVFEELNRCLAYVAQEVVGAPPPRLPHLNSAQSHGVPAEALNQARAEYEALGAESSVRDLMALEAETYETARSLMVERMAQVRSRRLAAPRRDLRIPAQAFQGRPDDPQAAAWVCALTPDGHLIYGPYEDFPPGRYQARFQLTLSGVSGAAGRLTLEAAAHYGGAILAQRKLSGLALRMGDYGLDFTCEPDMGALEFRIAARGFTAGQLTFRGVELRPRRAWRPPQIQPDRLSAPRPWAGAR